MVVEPLASPTVVSGFQKAGVDWPNKSERISLITLT
jgi:hypothetical protein